MLFDGPTSVLRVWLERRQLEEVRVSSHTPLFGLLLLYHQAGTNDWGWPRASKSKAVASRSFYVNNLHSYIPDVLSKVNRIICKSVRQGTAACILPPFHAFWFAFV